MTYNNYQLLESPSAEFILSRAEGLRTGLSIHQLLALRQASNELPNFVAVRSLGIAPEGRTGAQGERKILTAIYKTSR